MIGQSISVMGVWNVKQLSGEKVCEEVQNLVDTNSGGHIQRGKEALVLFEETDGFYLRLQFEK